MANVDMLKAVVEKDKGKLLDKIETERQSADAEKSAALPTTDEMLEQGQYELEAAVELVLSIARLRQGRFTPSAGDARKRKQILTLVSVGEA